MSVKCKSCGCLLRLGAVLGWGLTWVHRHSRSVRCNPRTKPSHIFADGPRVTDRMANEHILKNPECGQRLALGAVG